MKGDFTRRTFRLDRGYSSVRMQQGRVQLDADWNEQVEIQQHLARRQAEDTFGASGVPAETPFGFQIDVTAQGVSIGGGRIYVEGTLCELPRSTLFTEQQDLPGASLDVTFPALVYLDVWERSISALEDPEIAEVALGGPDTTTRTKTVCQVKLLPVAGVAAARQTDLRSALGRSRESVPIVARVTPGATLRGNHLLRVEVHAPPSAATGGAALLKWSRENGAAVAEWTGGSGREVTVRGRTRFAAEQFVELLDDARELQGRAGELRKIRSVRDDAGGQVLELDADVDAAQFTAERRKARRWDSTAFPVVPRAGEATLRVSSLEEIPFVPMEGAGVSILLLTSNDITYQTGDAWSIPVRQGGIETVPQPTRTPGLSIPLVLPAEEPHRFAKLAVLDQRPGGQLTVLADLRSPFAPLATISRQVAELERAREKMEYSLRVPRLAARRSADTTTKNAASLYITRGPEGVRKHLVIGIVNVIEPGARREINLDHTVTALDGGASTSTSFRVPGIAPIGDILVHGYARGDISCAVLTFLDQPSGSPRTYRGVIQEYGPVTSSGSPFGATFRLFERDASVSVLAFRSIAGFHDGGRHQIYLLQGGEGPQRKLFRATIPFGQDPDTPPTLVDTGKIGDRMAVYEVTDPATGSRSFRLLLETFGVLSTAGFIELYTLGLDGELLEESAVRVPESIDGLKTGVAGYFDGKYHHIFAIRAADVGVDDIVEFWFSDGDISGGSVNAAERVLHTFLQPTQTVSLQALGACSTGGGDPNDQEVAVIVSVGGLSGPRRIGLPAVGRR